MPYSHLPRDKAEALDALERLVLRHKLVGEDEAKRIARVITEDPSFQFPPPRPEPAPQEAPGEEAAGQAAAAPDASSASNDEREDEGQAPSTS